MVLIPSISLIELTKQQSKYVFNTDKSFFIVNDGKERSSASSKLSTWTNSFYSHEEMMILVGEKRAEIKINKEFYNKTLEKFDLTYREN